MPQNPAVTICDNFSRPSASIIKQFAVPTGYITDVQGRRGSRRDSCLAPGQNPRNPGGHAGVTRMAEFIRCPATNLETMIRAFDMIGDADAIES